jgi:hypothetical protein
MFTQSRLSGLILCGGIGTRRNSFLSTVDCAAVLSGAKPEEDAAADSGPASAEPTIAERDDGPAKADAPGVEVISSSSSSESRSIAMAEVEDEAEALGWEVTREMAGAGSSCDCSAFWRCDLWAMMS